MPSHHLDAAIDSISISITVTISVIIIIIYSPSQNYSINNQAGSPSFFDKSFLKAIQDHLRKHIPHP